MEVFRCDSYRVSLYLWSTLPSDYDVAVSDTGGPKDPEITRVRGRSSVVERQLPKLYVVGSIPIARSRFANDYNWLPTLIRVSVPLKVVGTPPIATRQCGSCPGASVGARSADCPSRYRRVRQ